MKPPSAEIITIGTELLLGDILDTNTRTIARELRRIGLDLYRTSAVGDNAERIAQVIKDSLTRARVVIAAGGLGPTIDDVTREGIAQAFGMDLEFHPELWEQIQERFDRFGVEPPENNRRQAMLPTGATAIENPVGTAPAFRVERDDQIVIALPGVPAELEHLLKSDVIPFLRHKFQLHGVIKMRVIRTVGVGESWLDERIGDLEKLSNPTVGIAAHPGNVDIRITAKAENQQEADEMIWKIESTLRQRLKDRIYGVDEQKLEEAALRSVEQAGWRVSVIEAGTGGALTSALANIGNTTFAGGRLFSELRDPALAMRNILEESEAEVGLLLRLESQEKSHDIVVSLQTPAGSQTWERSYGGALPNAPRWAVSLALDRLRRLTELGTDPPA